MTFENPSGKCHIVNQKTCGNVQLSQFSLLPWNRLLGLGLSTHWLAIESYTMWKICVLGARFSVKHCERLNLERLSGMAGSERVGKFSLPVHDHPIAYTYQSQVWAVSTALFTWVFPRGFGWCHVWHTVNAPLMCITAFPPIQELHEMLLAIYLKLMWTCPSGPLSMPHTSDQYLLILIWCSSSLVWYLFYSSGKLIHTNVLVTNKAIRVIALHRYLNERNLQRW